MSTAENPHFCIHHTGSETRIRRLLGVTRFEPLPLVDHDALAVYHDRLAESLVFPFAAEHCELDGPERRVTVDRLLRPTGEHADLDAGLMCQARQNGRRIEVPLAEIRVEFDQRNCQLIEDYWYWFWNWRTPQF